MTDKLRKKNEEIIKTNTDITCNKVRALLESITEEYGYMRGEAAEHIIVEALIWGGRNYYETIGIAESAKNRYNEAHIEAMMEETEPDNMSV